MATYNFTVRATDNSGAFADRNFAMTVNNTQIDRFIAVGSSGLARSQDGINWNVENTLTGNNVRWENNQWIVTHLVGTTNNGTPFGMIRTSPDGINWKSFIGSFVAHRTGYTSPASFGVEKNGDTDRIRGDSVRGLRGCWRNACRKRVDNLRRPVAEPVISGFY